jgi:predicted transcriptional regulator of viral defense system
MAQSEGSRPSWDQLFGTAVTQEGLFTTKQAAESGYSPQLLAHYVRAGKAVRVRRNIYRLVHFPAGEHEDLVAVWLWSERAGVLSHQTALVLHGLSDVMPAQIHLTLPTAWRHRRLRVPTDAILHHADVPPADRTWFGPVPTTSVRHTLNDCARAALAPDQLRQAAMQALRRGLVKVEEISEVMVALEPYGGIGE